MSEAVHIEIQFGESQERVRLHTFGELRRLPGVDKATFAPAVSTGSGPSGRDAAAFDFGKLILAIAPDAVKGVFAAIGSLFHRPGAPRATVKVKIGDSAIELEMDARDLTPETLVSLSERIAAALRTQGT